MSMEIDEDNVSKEEVPEFEDVEFLESDEIDEDETQKVVENFIFNKGVESEEPITIRKSERLLIKKTRKSAKKKKQHLKKKKKKSSPIKNSYSKRKTDNEIRKEISDYGEMNAEEIQMALAQYIFDEDDFVLPEKPVVLTEPVPSEVPVVSKAPVVSRAPVVSKAPVVSIAKRYKVRKPETLSTKRKRRLARRKNQPVKTMKVKPKLATQINNSNSRRKAKIETRKEISEDDDDELELEEIKLLDTLKVVLMCSNVIPFLSVDSLLICLYCDTLFRNASEFSEHSRTIHFEERYQNINNKMQFSTYCSKKYIKLDITDLKCIFCDEIMTDWGRFYYHLIGDQHRLYIKLDHYKSFIPFRLKHDEYKCVICSVEFSKFSMLTSHMFSHCKQGYVCDVCQEQFATLSLLNIHEEIHTKYPCDCNCKVTIRTRKKIPSRKLKIKKRIPCSLCNHVSYNLSDEFLHMVKEHEGSDRQVNCDYCVIGKLYNRKRKELKLNTVKKTPPIVSFGLESFVEKVKPGNSRAKVRPKFNNSVFVLNTMSSNLVPFTSRVGILRNNKKITNSQVS